jgi:hypothetical protein
VNKRFTQAERRSFLTDHGRRLPLLCARGQIVLGAEGPWRWAELRRGGLFHCAYEWRHGTLDAGGAVLLLPSWERVAFIGDPLTMRLAA